MKIDSDSDPEWLPGDEEDDDDYDNHGDHESDNAKCVLHNTVHPHACDLNRSRD